MPVAWGVGLAVVISFLIAAFTDGANYGNHLVAGLLYLSGMFGVSFLARYLTQGSGEYYRWDYEDWWIFTGDSDNPWYEEVDD